MPVLAIDQGTSSTKALVIDDNHTVLALVERPVFVQTRGDAVEVSPDDLWSSVVEAGRQAWRQAGRPLLDAVGLANQGETIVAWEPSTGAAVGAAIVWQDARSTPVCDSLRSSAERLAHITGLTLDPYFVAPKIAWLQPQNAPSLHITTSDTWLVHHMCGAFVTDVATAGRTLLADLETLTWSDEACELFGISSARLPAIVDNDAIVGATSVFTGAPVPVRGLCVDQQAALYAQRCWLPGEAKCTYGTGAFLLACTGATPTRSASGLVGCPAWRVGGTAVWCLDGQVFTVGAAVSWLERLGIITEPADLDRLGASLPVGPETFIPALSGHGSPFWRPQARGAFTGLGLDTGPAELVRAVIEGVAANVAWLALAAGTDLGSPLTRLRVDGGLTRSHTLLQVQADLLQVPVEVYPSPHATAFGVGAMAAGRLPAAGSGVVVEPAISADEANTRRLRWRSAAEATMDL